MTTSPPCPRLIQPCACQKAEFEYTTSSSPSQRPQTIRPPQTNGPTQSALSRAPSLTSPSFSCIPCSTFDGQLRSRPPPARPAQPRYARECFLAPWSHPRTCGSLNDGAFTGAGAPASCIASHRSRPHQRFPSSPPRGRLPGRLDNLCSQKYSFLAFSVPLGHIRRKSGCFQAMPRSCARA